MTVWVSACTLPLCFGCGSIQAELLLCCNSKAAVYQMTCELQRLLRYVRKLLDIAL